MTGKEAEVARGGQGLVRVAVVVRAGAVPLWWLGVVAAVAGLAVPGLTGRRIGAYAGAALFLIAAATVAYTRRKRYAELARAVVRAGRHDVLQDRRVTLRNWRQGHRRWLLGGFLAALAANFAVPVAGGLLLAGCGAGLWLKAYWLGRREQREDALLWTRVDWLTVHTGRPAGPRVRSYRGTGLAAGDAAPGGGRRR